MSAAWLRVEALDVVAAPGRPPLAHGVTLQLQPGQRLGLLGRNGAGKSTLLRQLAGLLPLAGARAQVWLDGHALPMLDAPNLARLRALMPAQPRDRFHLGVQALLELAQPHANAVTAREALQRLDAWTLRDRDVLALSAGERQRVALAQALVQGSPLLLLDEPAAFQDPAHQRTMGAMLQTLADRVVVFCAHDVNWVARYATHVLGIGGAPGDDGADWFFAPRAAALQPEPLQRLYGCAWTQLVDADGHHAWVTV